LFDEIRQKFITPISEGDRAKWIDKIWKTRKMESHADREPITLLYWLNFDGKPRKDENIEFLIETETIHRTDTRNG